MGLKRVKGLRREVRATRDCMAQKVHGAADKHSQVMRRFAPHNHADQADTGRKNCGFLAFLGLSAAPLGATTLGVTSNFLNLWLGE